MNGFAHRIACLLWIAWCVHPLGADPVKTSGYDPLRVSRSFAAAKVDLEVRDEARKRIIPVLVHLPATPKPAPVVLFSHGLGGSRTMNQYLAEHWAARGYVAVFLQHAGSDDSVWRDSPPAARMKRMREAASVENLRLRAQDIPAVLDQLEVWNADDKSPLAGRLDMKRVGMSGHSFGAVTTQAVGGQSMPVIGRKWTDPRIRAAVAFSPSAPASGNAGSAFGSVGIPWMLMTGTHDTSIIGTADLASRLAVYPALRGAPKYELVLDGAEHSAFSDRALPGDRMARDPNHHRVILALTTAFWDTWLMRDEAARSWLHGNGPKTVMQAADRWQFAAP